MVWAGKSALSLSRETCTWTSSFGLCENVGKWICFFMVHDEIRYLKCVYLSFLVIPCLQWHFLLIYQPLPRCNQDFCSGCRNWSHRAIFWLLSSWKWLGLVYSQGVEEVLFSEKTVLQKQRIYKILKKNSYWNLKFDSLLFYTIALSSFRF